MYTFQDEHYIKRDSDGLVFSKRAPEYQEFVDHCENNPAYSPAYDSANYDLAVGSLKGKKCFFLKRKQAFKDKQALNLDANRKRKRGLLIQALCEEVINYITGRNDQESRDVDAMLAAHGSIMTLLQQNRYSTAKTAIQNVTPDAHISQAEKDYVLNDIYPLYETKITELT